MPPGASVIMWMSVSCGKRTEVIQAPTTSGCWACASAWCAPAASAAPPRARIATATMTASGRRTTARTTLPKLSLLDTKSA